MTFTVLASTSFAYIACDVPAEQTLVEWRREQHAARRTQRPARRRLRLLPWIVRVAS